MCNQVRSAHVYVRSLRAGPNDGWRATVRGTRCRSEGELGPSRDIDATPPPWNNLRRTHPIPMPMSPMGGPQDFKHVLRAARAGDEAAWEELYRWLAPQVLGFLKAGRLNDPEDVVGDVFLEVARRIGDFRGDRRGFRAWVFTIARSRRIDEIRRRTRRMEDRLDTGEHAAVPSPIDVEGDAIGAIVLEDLMACLDLLTDDQSEVLIFRALGGWTAPEIAEITGRTVGSVEQLHHRATRALREILGDA